MVYSFDPKKLEMNVILEIHGNVETISSDLKKNSYPTYPPVREYQRLTKTASIQMIYLKQFIYRVI